MSVLSFQFLDCDHIACCKTPWNVSFLDRFITHCFSVIYICIWRYIKYCTCGAWNIFISIKCISWQLYIWINMLFPVFRGRTFNIIILIAVWPLSLWQSDTFSTRLRKLGIHWDTAQRNTWVRQLGKTLVAYTRALNVSDGSQMPQVNGMRLETERNCSPVPDFQQWRWHTRKCPQIHCIQPNTYINVAKNALKQIFTSIRRSVYKIYMVYPNAVSIGAHASLQKALRQITDPTWMNSRWCEICPYSNAIYCLVSQSSYVSSILVHVTVRQ